MKTVLLDINEDEINYFSFYCDDGYVDISVEFFDDKDARMVNAYAECPEEMDFDYEDNKYSFTGNEEKKIENKNQTLKIFLPKNRKYDFNIQNQYNFGINDKRNRKCSIKNGKFINLDVRSDEIYLENVEAINGAIIGGIKWSNINLKNCNLPLIGAIINNLNMDNTYVHRIDCFTSKNFNISNSHIDYIDTSYPSRQVDKNIVMENSVIKKLCVGKGVVFLNHCEIKNIIGESLDLKLNYCDYLENGYISLTKNSTLNIKNKEEYYTKKGFSNKMYLCEKSTKKKLIKVLNK